MKTAKMAGMKKRSGKARTPRAKKPVNTMPSWPSWPSWPSYGQWEAFARACWSEAQALAEICGKEEDLLESVGYQARHLGLPCSFTLLMIAKDKPRGDAP